MRRNSAASVSRKLIRDLLIGHLIINALLIFSIFDASTGSRIFGSIGVSLILSGVLFFYTILVVFMFSYAR